MLFRFRNVNLNKPTDLSFQIIRKPIVRRLSNARTVQRNTISEVIQAASVQPIENNAAIIRCRRPEFNFYVGQTYRPHQQISLASDGWNHHKSKGDYFTIHPVSASQTNEGEQMEFKDLPLNKRIIGALHENNLKTCMHVQGKAIPLILDGQNSILAAETGCGKTLAYLLPMLQQVLCCKNIKSTELNTPWGLIITPTRELAMQISKEAERFAYHLDIKVKVLTGGEIFKKISNPPVGQVDILVCSFGALMKFLSLSVYDLKYVKHIVLDEADALFHEAFHDRVRSFLKRIYFAADESTDDVGLPARTQLTLASATVPARVKQVLGDLIDVDAMVQVSTEKLHHVLVRQQFFRIGRSTKPMELLKYIKPKIAKRQPVIVFTNSTKTCDFVNIFLSEHNINAINIHGTMEWKYRKGKLNEFLRGESLVLTTTNTSSRGLDTTIIKYILNYDFPSETTEYIHRCGRTGRPGMKIEDCKVTNFIATTRDIALTQKIEMAVRKGKPLPIITVNRSHLLKEEEPLVQEKSNIREEDYIEDKIYEDIEEEGSVPY